MLLGRALVREAGWRGGEQRRWVEGQGEGVGRTMV